MDQLLGHYEGELLVLITFLVFGAAMLPDALQHLDWTWVLYGTLSLTIVRMIPIGLSLLGTGISLPSYLFLGWFGPRGLASILFALLILEEAELVHGRLVRLDEGRRLRHRPA